MNDSMQTPPEIPGVRRLPTFEFLYKPYRGGKSVVGSSSATDGKAIVMPPVDLRFAFSHLAKRAV